jgi:hypothetical protein
VDASRVALEPVRSEPSSRVRRTFCEHRLAQAPTCRECHAIGSTDGSIVGCTEFTLPTTGIDWRTVRGMAWVAGKLVYGSTDGYLRTVAFDPAAATAVNGATATVVAAPATGAIWSNPTLFFATS